jgi:imidazolonepropionase-like amidohydrolase
MKTRASVCAAIFAFSFMSALAQSPPSNLPATSVIVNAARLLDVRKESYVQNAAVWIEGDRIREVGLASDIQAPAPRSAKVTDLGSATVLPGLIDCAART